MALHRTETNGCWLLGGRFLTEISSGGNIDRIDDLVAPNYVNGGMGNADLAGFKAMLSAMPAASDVAIEDLSAKAMPWSFGPAWK